MADKKQYATLTALKRYKAGHIALKSATYAAPLVPFAVELGVNWGDWFSSSDAPSIGVGFGMLIVSTVTSIVMVMKKDEDFMKKFSPLLYVAVVLVLWAATFMFLASIMNEMGQMLLYAALGILVGASADEADSVAVKPKYELYKRLAEQSGLTDNGKFVKKATEQALRDKLQAEKDAMEAVE